MIFVMFWVFIECITKMLYTIIPEESVSIHVNADNPTCSFLFSGTPLFMVDVEMSTIVHDGLLVSSVRIRTSHMLMYNGNHIVNHPKSE